MIGWKLQVAARERLGRRWTLDPVVFGTTMRCRLWRLWCLLKWVSWQPAAGVGFLRLRLAEAFGQMHTASNSVMILRRSWNNRWTPSPYNSISFKARDYASDQRATDSTVALLSQ